MNGGHHLYDPSEMDTFCEIHAPGLLDEIYMYTSMLNESKEIPTAKRKELQRVRTVPLQRRSQDYFIGGFQCEL